MSTCLPNILITGGHGQIASALRHQNQQAFTLHFYEHTALDITKKSDIWRAFSNTNPDVVINTAAYTDVNQAEREQEKATAINQYGAENLAEICANKTLPLIHLSTDYIFSGKKRTPYYETDSAEPLNHYGRSKWLGEEAVRSHCKNHIILRLSAVFSEYGHNFLKTMLRLLKQNKPLQIVADQITSPTSAHDIAATLLTVAAQKTHSTDSKHTGTYHYCSSESVSWYAFTQQIAETAKANGYEIGSDAVITPIRSADYAATAARPAYSVLACEKIFKDFCIAQPDWRSSLNQIFVNGYRDAALPT